MDTSEGYILLIGQQKEACFPFQFLLRQFGVSLVAVSTLDQAITHLKQRPPYLVILSGSRAHDSLGVVYRLRETAKPAEVTIVALTETHDPRWSPQEDHPGLDGFLVKPLSADVLNSVIASALAKTGLNSVFQLHPSMG